LVPQHIDDYESPDFVFILRLLGNWVLIAAFLFPLPGTKLGL
jgi:hypothetical protein